MKKTNSLLSADTAPFHAPDEHAFAIEYNRQENAAGMLMVASDDLERLRSMLQLYAFTHDDQDALVRSGAYWVLDSVIKDMDTLRGAIRAAYKLEACSRGKQ